MDVHESFSVRAQSQPRGDGMYKVSVVRVGVSAVVLFLASCAAESSGTSSGAVTRGRSSLDPPPAPVEDGLAVAPTHNAAARVPGGRQVGHYDMSAQQGQPYEVPPIVAGGGTAVSVVDPDAATLG